MGAQIGLPVNRRQLLLGSTAVAASSMLPALPVQPYLGGKTDQMFSPTEWANAHRAMPLEGFDFAAFQSKLLAEIASSLGVSAAQMNESFIAAGYSSVRQYFVEQNGVRVHRAWALTK